MTPKDDVLRLMKIVEKLGDSLTVTCLPNATHVAGVPGKDRTQRCVNCDAVLLDRRSAYPPGDAILWMCPGDRVTITNTAIRYVCPHRKVLEESARW